MSVYNVIPKICEPLKSFALIQKEQKEDVVEFGPCMQTSDIGTHTKLIYIYIYSLFPTPKLNLYFDSQIPNSNSLLLDFCML